jgi:hypothetical protein
LGDALQFGITITDRYKGYNFLEMIKRGICHAHCVSRRESRLRYHAA